MPLDAKVMTLREFFTKYRKLVVPNYQRAYKWQDEYVEDLFTDILEGLRLREGAKDRSCFLGSVVLSHDTGTGMTDLVDGQQRLTTLSVLISCLSKKVTGNDKLKKEVRKLLTSDGANSIILHKQQRNLSCDDRCAFREIAINDEPNLAPFSGDKTRNQKWKKEFESHLIVKAYQTLDKKVSDFTQPQNGQQPIDAASILETIINGIKLVVIDTDERKEGMRVFASINASGTKLESWELVMSAFYSHGTSEEATRRTEDFFEGTRHSLATAFASTDASESDSMKNDFLRSHWISLNGNILKDELFDSYNDELARDPSQHEKFLRQLEKSLRTYRAFNDYKYSHPEAGVISFDFLQTLNSLQAKLSRPALLAVASLFDDPEDLQDAMLRSAFIFEKLHMRWKICNRRTNTIDQPLAELAKKISKGTLGRTPKEVADGITTELKKIKDAPTREDLVDDFMLRDMTRETKLSKAIASRIHHAMRHPTASNRSLDYKHIPLLTGGGYTLEKGIKLMINQYVESTQQGYGFRDDYQFRELIYSLGNTFLAQNGRINPNLEFNGRHAISRLDAKTIKIRCEELAEVAADIWHF
jgi:hypothetical protein